MNRLQVLASLYGERAPAIDAAATAMVRSRPRRTSPAWSERDAWLIAYPDQFRRRGEVPLATLRDVVVRHLQPEITGVHVLPFHPSSSDRGFSVEDHAAVDPAFGTWADVRDLAARTRLMADAVVNHVSSTGSWFRAFLAGDASRARFFRTVDPAADLSAVVRPRTSPLVTTFAAADGPVHVWTTFSADQVDVDVREPDVLLALLETLLRYVDAGAGAIRLDAIAFLWKREGTASINLPETHAVVRLLRSWLDEVDPGLVLVTETNVPHAENVRYLGAGHREAQAVYQFALPPLALHAARTGDPAALVAWAGDASTAPPGCTYLNFLSSHDGIGLRPAEGLLAARDVDALVALCERSGGAVNVRAVAGGTTAPYELAGTWYGVLAGIDDGHEAALARHLATHAVMLAMRGIPLLYTHGLLASGHDTAGYARTGVARDLNRMDFDPVDDLEATLADRTSRRARALAAIRTMLRWRASSPAFHPESAQRVEQVARSVVVVERTAAQDAARVYVNVGSEPVDVAVRGHWRRFDSGEAVSRLVVPALGSVWIRRDGPTLAG